VGEAAPVSTRELTLNAGFEELYVDAWPRLYRYVWLFVRNHEDAEDVAAEAVRRALGAWQRGRGPRGDPMAWLFLIARRLVIDRHRRSPIRWLPLSSVDRTFDGSNSLGDSEAAVWFDQLRSNLSPRQHEALLLRYLFDLSDEQIGHLMGLSAAGVRTNLSRAVAALRAHPEVLS